MVEKTQKQMIQETHQGMFGVGGTEDKGLIGDVKEIKRDLNGRVSRNSRLIFIIIGILIALGAVSGAEAADIIHILGG